MSADKVHSYCSHIYFTSACVLTQCYRPQCGQSCLSKQTVSSVRTSGVSWKSSCYVCIVPGDCHRELLAFHIAVTHTHTSFNSTVYPVQCSPRYKHNPLYIWTIIWLYKQYVVSHWLTITIVNSQYKLSTYIYTHIYTYTQIYILIYTHIYIYIHRNIYFHCLMRFK